MEYFRFEKKNRPDSNQGPNPGSQIQTQGLCHPKRIRYLLTKSSGDEKKF